MEALCDLQVRNQEPLILVGPPGVGKSRLAWECIRELNRRGVITSSHAVDVASHHDLGSVLSVIAASLRTERIASDRSDAIADLLETLITRPASALLFDNAERLAGEMADVAAEIVSHVPDCRIFVTSRQSTSVQNGRIVRVEPLSVSDSARLFTVRAEEQTGGRGFDPASPSVRELVQELDGLPLAIELAAARARVLSVPQMQHLLSQRLQLLRSTDPSQTDVRTATLEGTLDWSWETLDAWERDVLSQIAVFSGPFSLEDADNVLKLGDRAPWIVDLLQGLYDRSLIYVRQPEGELSVQYGMYQSIRDYVFKRADGEVLAAARRRYSARYIEQARVWASRFDSIGEHVILDWFELQRPHILQVIEDGIRTDPLAAADMLLEIDIVLAAREPFDILHSLYHRVLDALPLDEQLRRAKLMRRCGHEMLLRGRIAEGAPFIEQAVQLAPACMSGPERVRTDMSLGLLRMRQFKYDESRDLLMRVRDSDALRDDPSDFSRACLYLGMLSSALAENDIDNRPEHLEQALAWYREALHHASSLQANRFLAALCANIGNVYQRLDMRAEQRHFYERSLQHACQVGHRMLEGIALANLAWVALLEGDLHRADQLLDQSLPLQHLIRRFNAEGLVHQRRGLLESLRENWNEASASFIKASDLFACSHEFWLAIDTTILLGLCRLGAGRPEEARHHALDARHAANKADDAPRASLANWLLAASAALAGDRDLDAILQHADKQLTPRHSAAAPQLVAIFQSIVDAGRNDRHQNVHRARQRFDDLTNGFPFADRATSLLPDVRIAALVLQRLLRVRTRNSSSVVTPLEGFAATADGRSLPDSILRVGERHTWFAIDDEPVIDLSRRRVVRALFAELVRQRLNDPASPVSVQQLIQAAWPGQKFVGDSAANRVYVAIAALRNLGLGDLLQTRSGGYMLEPHAELIVDRGHTDSQ